MVSALKSLLSCHRFFNCSGTDIALHIGSSFFVFNNDLKELTHDFISFATNDSAGMSRMPSIADIAFNLLCPKIACLSLEQMKGSENHLLS
jgi:hypothetical protein